MHTDELCGDSIPKTRPLAADPEPPAARQVQQDRRARRGAAGRATAPRSAPHPPRRGLQRPGRRRRRPPRRRAALAPPPRHPPPLGQPPASRRLRERRGGPAPRPPAHLSQAPVSPSPARPGPAPARGDFGPIFGDKNRSWAGGPGPGRRARTVPSARRDSDRDQDSDRDRDRGGAGPVPAARCRLARGPASRRRTAGRRPAAPAAGDAEITANTRAARDSLRALAARPVPIQHFVARKGDKNLMESAQKSNGERSKSRPLALGASTVCRPQGRSWAAPEGSRPRSRTSAACCSGGS